MEVIAEWTLLLVNNGSLLAIEPLKRVIDLTKQQQQLQYPLCTVITYTWKYLQVSNRDDRQELLNILLAGLCGFVSKPVISIVQRIHLLKLVEGSPVQLLSWFGDHITAHATTIMLLTPTDLDDSLSICCMQLLETVIKVADRKLVIHIVYQPCTELKGPISGDDELDIIHRKLCPPQFRVADVINKLLKFSRCMRCRWYIYRILTIVALALYDVVGIVIAKILVRYQHDESQQNAAAISTLLNHLLEANPSCQYLTEHCISHAQKIDNFSEEHQSVVSGELKRANVTHRKQQMVEDDEITEYYE